MVRLALPGALRPLVGGARTVELDCADGSLADVLDAVAASHPALARRIRDEQGALRRYVNVYVDGEDVRSLDGLQTPVPDRGEVLIMPSVAGG
jgi:molybdopterin synthase sulfur carrier subunit